MLIGAMANAVRTSAALVSADGVVLQQIGGGPGRESLAALVRQLQTETDRFGIGVVLDDPQAAELKNLPPPLQVATVVQALTWGEARFGIGRRYRDVAVVHAGIEIEVGLVLGGLVLPQPGRLGHTSVDRTGHWTCRCGRVGCLQALVDAAMQGLVPSAPALPSTLPPAPSAAHSYLALGLVHLVNTLNPAAIVLAGPLIDAAPDALFWLSHAVRTAALMPSRAGLIEVTAPHAGPLSILVGAAAFARGADP
jgi:hypothetical protein